MGDDYGSEDWTPSGVMRRLGRDDWMLLAGALGACEALAKDVAARAADHRVRRLIEGVVELRLAVLVIAARDGGQGG